MSAPGRLQVGDGSDSRTDMGPVINADAVHKDFGLHRDRRARRRSQARLPEASASPRATSPTATLLNPRFSSDVEPEMRIAQEEIFGPVTTVIPADSLEHAIEIANGVRYGLSAAIYTRGREPRFSRDGRAVHRHRLRQLIRPSAPKSTFLSAAPKRPATDTAKPAHRCSTSSPNGNPSTWTTAGRLQRAQIDQVEPQ
ncbi:MAG: aldehyde dehydrogenase family protein [Pyrinomonadaceae bacterium]